MSGILQAILDGQSLTEDERRRFSSVHHLILQAGKDKLEVIEHKTIRAYVK